MNTKLSTISGRQKKSIDMEYVYAEINKGRSVISIAKELNVSRQTIYNHQKYQKKGSLNDQKPKPAADETMYPELGENPFE